MIFFTGKGVPVQVSDEDEPIVRERKWHQGVFGYIGTNIKLDGRWRAVKLHRWLLGVTDPNIFVDHINGDPTDNRRENLRLCTRAQNAANQRPRPGVSQFKGVSIAGEGRARPWRASIQGRVIGHFATETEAAVAYDTAARETYGEHAYLNFPGSNERLHGTQKLFGKCLHCGSDFEAKLVRRAYCSKSCCSLAWQKRKRKRAPLGIFG